MNQDKMIRIYTDGGCKPNPGPGGWGAIILRPESAPIELSGGAVETTNNRMELTAAIEALRTLGAGETGVLVISDSKYVRDGITTWIVGWKRRGWVTGAGSDVVNRDLWEELDRLRHRHQVKFMWVKGHNGHEQNERCDALATQARLAAMSDTDAVKTMAADAGLSVATVAAVVDGVIPAVKPRFNSAGYGRIVG